jgi:S-formylglutathione hydrolase FrmB
MGSNAALLILLALFISMASAGVVVTKTGKAPTGYEVTITYTNTNVSEVTVGGLLPAFTNQWHTTSNLAARLLPYNFKPGDFPCNNDTFAGYAMESTGNGSFTFTAPFPSGTYTYAFRLDNTTEIRDPENLPFETVPGKVMVSTFQVPFDPHFQTYDDMNLNFDYALPVEDEAHRGVVKAQTYPSPGSVSPAPGVHDFAVYLPAGYNKGAAANKTYPLVYLSHGGRMGASDWQAKGKIGNIMDRLIRDRHLPPTIVVMPTFDGLTATSAVNWSASEISSLYQTYLFPYVETHYAVSRDPASRAFAGLSLGGRLSYELYVNATSYFGYYGMFSGALFTDLVDDYIGLADVRNNPALADRGLFVGYGQYDAGAANCILLRQALDIAHIRHVGRMAPWGYHAWNTWQDNFWWFGRLVLFKPRPVTDEVGHGL